MSDFEQTTPEGAENVTGKNDPFGEFVRHQRNAFDETIKAVDALFPKEFKDHSREAGREFTKGVKVLVDAVISELEKASREFDKNFNAQRPAEGDTGSDRPSSTGSSKVKVQVE